MDEQPVPPSALVTIDEDVLGPGVDWRTANGMQDSRDASWVLFSADAGAALRPCIAQRRGLLGR